MCMVILLTNKKILLDILRILFSQVTSVDIDSEEVVRNFAEIPLAENVATELEKLMTFGKILIFVGKNKNVVSNGNMEEMKHKYLTSLVNSVLANDDLRQRTVFVKYQQHYSEHFECLLRMNLKIFVIPGDLKDLYFHVHDKFYRRCSCGIEQTVSNAQLFMSEESLLQ